jgi:N-acetylglucosamine-6-sulfatase
MLDNGVAEETIRRRAEMVLAVDDGLGRIIEALETQGQLDNTLIVFTSDNGFFFGEHGLSVERRLPYEESVKAPLLIRYPKLVKPKQKIEGLAVSIDLAPTILDIANVTIPEHVQGLSLRPLFNGNNKSVHDAILMEYYSHENPFYWTVNLDYRTVRKGDYKYIRWLRFQNQAELYDLKKDPYEQHNLINEPVMEPIISELQQDMQLLVLDSLGLLE